MVSLIMKIKNFFLQRKGFFDQDEVDFLGIKGKLSKKYDPEIGDDVFLFESIPFVPLPELYFLKNGRLVLYVSGLKIVTTKKSVLKLEKRNGKTPNDKLTEQQTTYIEEFYCGGSRRSGPTSLN